MKTVSWAVCFAATIGLSLQASGAVWLVDVDNVSGVEDGTSWATAFTDIQAAVNAAGGGDQVWVAAGTYTAASSPVVAMKANVEIYGGFTGTEGPGDFVLRDIETNPTVIDGENTRRGVTGVNNATIDGFTITRCVPTTTTWGGGMQCQNASPTISNCTFQANAGDVGAGLGVSGSSATITDCRFLANTAGGNGGAGLYAGNSTSIVTGCLFAGNYTSGDGGGVLAGGASTDLTFTDCTFASNESWRYGAGVQLAGDASASFSGCRFVGNEVSGDGGGVSSEDGDLTLTNCLFTGNSSLYGGSLHKWSDGVLKMTNCTLRRNWCESGGAYDGGNIYGECDSATITNCILWEGQKADGTPNEMDFYASVRSYSYNDVAGGIIGTANIDADPVFRAGRSGTVSGLAYDAATCASTVTDASATFTPGALAGLLLLVEPLSQYDPPRGYLIVDNDATTITAWADVTLGGTVTAPRSYEILDWHLRGTSPCADAGRDTSDAGYGSVTADIEGDLRGYDGRDDGPTGPPEPGDGSDYDMGADEYPGGDVELSDLQATVTLTPPTPLAGEQFTIEVTVENNGPVAAGASVVSIEAPGDFAPVTYAVPALDIGESHVVQRQMTLAEGENYSITAVAYFDGTGTDPDPSNNTSTVVFNVTAFDPCDINRDGNLNAVDVQLVINGALGLDIGAWDADVDNEGHVNAIDVQMVINAVLQA